MPVNVNITIINNRKNKFDILVCVSDTKCAIIGLTAIVSMYISTLYIWGCTAISTKVYSVSIIKLLYIWRTRILSI